MVHHLKQIFAKQLSSIVLVLLIQDIILFFCQYIVIDAFKAEVLDRNSHCNVLSFSILQPLHCLDSQKVLLKIFLSLKLICVCNFLQCLISFSLAITYLCTYQQIYPYVPINLKQFVSQKIAYTFSRFR